jgi:hypothetical protein
VRFLAPFFSTFWSFTMNKFARVLRSPKAATTAALAVIAATNAQAAAVDVSAVVTEIGLQAGPVSLIGTAILALFVGIKAFKWVQKVLG